MTTKLVPKNSLFVQLAAVELLAVNLKHADVTDKYREEAGQILIRCFSQMENPELTREQRLTREATLAERIRRLSAQMEAALVKARLLSDWPEELAKLA
jgi:methionyl-tRNA formyltransferase